MEQALADIRVLDLGQLVRGPQAAAALADMGADVIKLNSPSWRPGSMDILFPN